MSLHTHQLPTPKICVSFDQHHKNKDEIQISNRLAQLNPLEKIVFFKESRHVEQESLGQYSLELLAKDSTYSTSNSASLLLAHVMIGSGHKEYLVKILSLMYVDPYFKQLFTGNHYNKYTPQKYNLFSRG